MQRGTGMSIGWGRWKQWECGGIQKELQVRVGHWTVISLDRSEARRMDEP